jgi:peptidoglycan/xylan/chitin deacetylase (PgdA/CDA1 family)
METSTDEGEPAASPLSLSFLFISFLVLVSCTDSSNYPTGDRIETGHKVKIVTRPAKAVTTVVTKKGKTKKKIYLTFDDGPNKGTQNVLDIVNQENIPATFFIVGEHVFDSPMQKRVWDSLKASANIELCNHSYTHAHNKYDRFYLLPETVVRDMEMTREKLLPETNIVRAPGRNSWRIDSLHFTDIKKSKAAMDSLQKAGFIVMGWDLEWHYDPKTFQVKNTADELLSQVDSIFKKGKTKIPDNLVILAHDQVYRSAADSLQLREFIQKLKAKEDYELSLVSSYPAIKKKPVTDSLANTKILSPDTIKRQKADSL